MKIRTLKLLLILTLFFTVSLSFFATRVEAQSCTGSVTCENNCANIKTPSGCKSNCPVIDPGCVECTGTERVCDESQVRCGFDNVWSGVCAADCTSVGGTNAGGNCRAVFPPPPPTATPRPITRYGCSGTSCVVQSGGPYTVSNCYRACEPSGPPPPPPEPDMYSCSGPGGACQVSATGTYTTDNCDGACAPSPTSPPPPTCEPEHKSKTANIWIRVISKSSTGQTVAWKGNETNSPISADSGWSGAAPSRTATGDQYFTTYNSYATGSQKTFDMTKNKISSNMKLTVGVANPGSHETVEDACNTTRNVYIAEDKIAHPGMWSNHFCSGGKAFAQSGNYPAKTNNYCASDIGGPVYWADDYNCRQDVSNNSCDIYDDNGNRRDMDCDGDPLIWAAKDRDGCYGSFMQYSNGNIPNAESGVFASMHDQLVPLLQFADSHHWADLSYDGYWSYQYQAYDEWDSFNGIHAKIVITPPAGQLCENISWFSRSDSIKEEQAIAETLANGDCKITFNPKDGGNVLVVEMTEEPRIENCTVQLSKDNNNWSSDLTVESGEPAYAWMVGNTNDPGPNQKFNLLISRINSNPAAAATTIQLPLPSFGENGGNAIFGVGRTSIVTHPTLGYYYRYGSPAPCSPTDTNPVCTESVVMNAPTQDGMQQLPTGLYAVHCENQEPSFKCSGNPVCTWNGFNVSCTTPDCTDDTTHQGNTDHAVLRVQCTNSCNSCSEAGDIDSCTGLACPVGSAAAPPFAPTLTAPALTQEVTSGTFPIAWTPPADTTNLDTYQYIVFKKNSFNNNPDTALAENAAYYSANYAQHPDIQTLASTNSTAFSQAAPTTASFGRDVVVAVRAMNSPVGACPGNTPTYSSWSIAMTTLVGTVSGNIYNDEDDNGPPNSTLVTNFNQGIVTFAPNVPGFGNQVTFNNASGYSLPNVPYSPLLPPGWVVPQIRRLQIVNDPTHPENTYVCSNYSSNTGYYICELGNTYSPQADAHFYVKNLNLAFDPWWQTWGGSVFGRTAVGSAVPFGNSSPCALSGSCHPHLVAANYGYPSPAESTAGIPVSSGAITTGTENRYSQNAGNPRAESVNTILKENYSYFIAGVDMTIPTTSNGATDIRTGVASGVDSFTEDLAAGALQNDAVTRVSIYPGNLALNLSTGPKINIPSGQKYVVFVAGDLVIQGPVDKTFAAQSGLITVNSGGYLAFIVNGNITVESTVGYDDNNSDFADDSLAQLTAPIIDGVYIANGVLKIASNIPGNDQPGDFKFVGAGTFVGWSGVTLERKFDSSNAARRQLNNTSPTELFIHRPDFVTHAPSFINRPQLKWQEVN